MMVGCQQISTSGTECIEPQAHLEPFGALAIPVADKAGWTDNDDPLGYGISTKSLMTILKQCPEQTYSCTCIANPW